MKNLSLNMSIANQFRFDFVNSIEIESSWEMLTDTCSILLPANLKMDKNKLREIVKPGDTIFIELGYDDKLTKVFDGNIVGIKPKTPIELHCEDLMYGLKQSSITDTMKQATLKKIMSKHFPKMEADCADVEIGTIQFDRLSQAKILEKLRENYGVYSFFRKGKLTVDKIYNPQTALEHYFKFQFNILEESLEYMRKDDMKLKVTAISTNPDGTVTEAREGDDGGEERTLKYYNRSKKALGESALKELNRLKYDGYHGDFTTFGEPVVFHGDIVNLEHPEESDKAGRYWVDRVIYNFGVDGFRQKITLGPKL